MTSPRLTDKQRAFVYHYITTFSAAEAARRAGYSEKTARFIGHENLTKPYIRAEIDRYLTGLAMSAAEVLARLSDIARADMGDFLTIGEDGKWDIDLTKAESRGKLHLIKHYRTTDHGQSLELYDVLTALYHMGQYHGLFTTRVNVRVSADEPLMILVKELRE